MTGTLDGVSNQVAVLFVGQGSGLTGGAGDNNGIGAPGDLILQDAVKGRVVDLPLTEGGNHGDGGTGENGRFGHGHGGFSFRTDENWPFWEGKTGKTAEKIKKPVENQLYL